ncbi:Nuf2 family-domain-containing protein [Leucosporidium creatinivorum]|uniref:Nuf2 family-domain-containing protein n=1 Tax=Leucosporidium creatinivorum TaxID=106004 RepID=A0A1Y2FZP1_9BASI|nr:Nuf2 family-domain-containing protein [Leucosporidium creatinivorum]
MPPAPAPSFPLAESPELIVEACSEINCPLTVHEIQHPTPAKVQAVYEAWMLKILDINLEDCIKAAKDQLDHMDHYEIHQEALYIGVFYHTFSQLLALAQIHDFTVSDLTAPTYQRFYHVLSGLLNFYDFEMEQRSETLLPLIEENAALMEREEALMQEIQDKKDMIAQEKEKRRKNEPRLAEYREKEKAGNIECVKMMETAKELADRNTEMKAKLKELQAENAQTTLEARNRELEINRYKSQLVQSPERIKSDLGTMAEHLARDTEELKLIEAKERQMQGKIASLVRYEGELATCIKLLEEWDIDVAKLAEGTSRHQRHLEKHEALLAEQQDFENQINLLDRRIQNVREEIARFDEKTERKRSAGKQRKKSLEEQHAGLLEKKRGLEMRAAEKNREAGEVEAQIRAIHAATHAELDRGETAFKKIKDQVEVYSLKINKALDSINTLNAQPIDLGA